MNLYHIPCLHECGKAAWDQTVPDHHPITREEMHLLILAAQTEGEMARAEVHIRLQQGVPGYTCPIPLKGPVRDAMFLISRCLDRLCNGGENYAPVPLKGADMDYLVALTSEPSVESVRLLASRINYQVFQYEDEETIVLEAEDDHADFDNSPEVWKIIYDILLYDSAQIARWEVEAK